MSICESGCGCDLSRCLCSLCFAMVVRYVPKPKACIATVLALVRACAVIF